jgi:hypothetical protein
MTRYQIISLGSKNRFLHGIYDTIFRHTRELGVSDDAIVLIDASNFKTEYIGNAPTFCLYFGEDAASFLDEDLVQQLIIDGTLILPIVPDIRHFPKLVPPSLHHINGMELSSPNEMERIASRVLEGLGLLRLSRRLFISYKRDESSAVAIQLFERLEKAGFDVFLDTHSILPGDVFQDELWHRMADTDVVVLLNTPGFLKSHWTTRELAKANAMSIGILQLIWPSHTLERDAELSIPVYLKDSDFAGKQFDDAKKSHLEEDALNSIVQHVESLRARSLASRQDNIISEFVSSSGRTGKKVNLQPEKFITVQNDKGKEYVIIPTVGVPQAFTYNQSEEIVARIKSKTFTGIYLLFDDRNIREKWLQHLAWLDNYLPIKTIKIVEAEEWLKKI